MTHEDLVKIFGAENVFELVTVTTPVPVEKPESSLQSLSENPESSSKNQPKE